MLFFQAALLAGYGYAHGAVARLSPAAQRLLHLALLTASLALLPIDADPSWKPVDPDDPTARILGLLVATVGFPFFLLASTSPLVQAWHARCVQSASPYRLYAWSNAGSLLALVTYPFLVEPFWTTAEQVRAWSIGYVAFAVLSLATAAASRPAALTAAVPAASPTSPPPAIAIRLVWLALAACGSTLFLAVTNEITLNIAAVPFLWILPLSLYLATFILCFESDRWYRRTLYLRALVAAVAVITFKVSLNERIWFPYEIGLFVAGLFVCCMICHGELARLRPPPEHLTSFYLSVAVGGALGGTFVGILAPRLFATTLELPIALGGCVVLALLAASLDPASALHAAPKRRLAVFFAALTLILGCAFGTAPQWQASGSRVAARNFYGTIRVNDLLPLREMPAKRELVHGVITHGYQYLDADWRRRGVAYYGPESGVGIAFRLAGEEPGRRVGVIGLGVGTLAAFGRAGDVIRFYELNPLVVDIARTEFTYLDDSAADVEVAVGDGRLLLERE
ncbi:MAG: hypothetical protein ACREQ9_26075, partial [Candidatus Binatia bacterium]